MATQPLFYLGIILIAFGFIAPWSFPEIDAHLPFSLTVNGLAGIMGLFFFVLTCIIGEGCALLTQYTLHPHAQHLSVKTVKLPQVKDDTILLNQIYDVNIFQDPIQAMFRCGTIEIKTLDKQRFLLPWSINPEAHRETLLNQVRGNIRVIGTI